jgi:hypothetical protein
LIIDLHTHTRTGSDDSFIDIPDLVERARKAGLDGVCITDHDWFWKPGSLEKLSEEHDFLLLPGVEMNTEDGHLLVFGLEKYAFGMYRTATLKQALNELGGVMILAHPFRRNMYFGEDIETAVERYSHNPVFSLVDILETHNGRAADRQNRFSQELCRCLGLRSTGGSDAHQLSDIPSGATYFERPISNLRELIDELKSGRFRPVDLRQGC